MLPPGHIAGGYLTAYALIKLAHPALDDSQIKVLLLTGASAGFAPDLDSFYAFFRAKSFTIQNNEVNHRGFLSHTPAVWLMAGLLITVLTPDTFWRCFGLLVWLGSWSHFALDSLEHGVRWLWPFSTRFYALKNPGRSPGLEKKGFIRYWLKFLDGYIKRKSLTFILEILIIIVAFYIFLK